MEHEERDRVGDPRQLEAAPGERAALDVGARGIRLEAPALDTAGEAATRACLVERAGLDVDQVRRPGVERMAEGRIAREARGQLGLVVGGQEERLAEADDAEGVRDRRATGLRVVGGPEDREQPIACRRGGRVAGAGPGGLRALDRGAQRGEVEVVLERRKLGGDEGARRPRAERGAAGEEDAAERQPAPAHAAYTDWAAASATPGVTGRPSARNASSSAARIVSTCARRLDSPMTPMRHTFPFIGPSPPPISMPFSARSRVRTRASSTPSGTVTAFSMGRRWPSSAASASPSAPRPAASASWFCRCRAKRASSPSSAT